MAWRRLSNVDPVRAYMIGAVATGVVTVPWQTYNVINNRPNWPHGESLATASLLTTTLAFVGAMFGGAQAVVWPVSVPTGVYVWHRRRKAV